MVKIIRKIADNAGMPGVETTIRLVQGAVLLGLLSHCLAWAQESGQVQEPQSEQEPEAIDLQIGMTEEEKTR